MAAPLAASGAEQPSLCGADEKPVFACMVKGNGKLASVCLGKGHVFYRFGKPDKVELEYPDSSHETPPGKLFEYHHLPYSKGQDNEFSFANGNIQYVITQHESAQGDDFAEINVDATKPDRKTGKPKHFATVACSSYVEHWELLKGVVPDASETAAQTPGALVCKGQKPGDKATSDAREQIEKGRIYSYAVKTFGAPTSCSVKTTTYEGQVFPTFSYKFNGAEYEEASDPPESSRSELKAAKGFPDEKAVRALLKDEAKEIGLSVDWSQGGDDPDTKTYEDPDANAQIELDYEHGKVMSFSIGMAL